MRCRAIWYSSFSKMRISLKKGACMNERDAKPATDALGSVEQDRIVMLSDGVFAIAITLLVLDIRVPNGVNSSDVSAIVRSLLPHFIGYTISFIEPRRKTPWL